MQERVRIFTDTTGTGHTLIRSDLEDQINEWLAATQGEFVCAAQSESRSEKTNHLTVTVWYRSQKPA